MEGFTQGRLASSKEELSSGMLENDQSWNTAVANVCTTHGFKNTTPPLDSQLSHASAASSAHSFLGGFPSAGTSMTSGGHQFDIEARMTSDNFRATGSADAFSQRRQDTTSHVPFPVWTNFGVLPHQQQQSMPINMIEFQQNSLHNMATAYDAVQLGGTYPLRSYPKDTTNMQGNRDAVFDLNISAMAMESSGDSMAMPQAAVLDYGHSKIQPLGRQTVDHGSEQQNVVISNRDTCKYSRNFDRRFMALQSRTAAEGCSMAISGSNVTTGQPLWGHADMDVSHLGQHTPGGAASLGNNLDGHSLLNYDVASYNCMLLNNIQQKNLNDPSNIVRTANGIHIDSGNVKYGVAVTPSLTSHHINQLQPDIYTQAWLNQNPCSSSQMYRRRVRMASPASIRQPMQMGCNFSDLSSATASATGSVFPGITRLAGEGRASMRPYTSIQKSDATLIPMHKRKVHPPTGMGDAISRKTQQNAYAVNFSRARFVPSTTDQYVVSPQISQFPPNSTTGPGSVRSSIPTTKQEQFVPPQFQSAMSLPETPIHFRQPAPSVRSPLTQQPIAVPSSSTRRPPISPLHISIPPGPRGKCSPPAAPKPERSKISPVICFKSQKGLDHPLGYKCGICKRDVTYASEGPIAVPTAPLPVAVLPCGHTFHDQCLQAITPKEQEKDPPCIPCAMGED